MDWTDDDIELVAIPACPRCTCAMHPGVMCVWPYRITVWICHCAMAVAMGDDNDQPPEEFVQSFSFLMAHGHLQVPR